MPLLCFDSNGIGTLLNDTEAISGERIAQEFYLNFDYANRIFRKITGCTIVRYRNSVRIQHAKAKMRAINAPVKEIAAELGFENVHDLQPDLQDPNKRRYIQ